MDERRAGHAQATFRLNVPDTFAVAGTGKSYGSTPMAARNAVEAGGSSNLRMQEPRAPWEPFVTGNLQLIQAGGKE